MTADELAEACLQALNQGRNQINLVVPGPPPRGERIRLAPGKDRCPMGEILNWKPDETLGRFDILDVLAWLTAEGFIRMSVLPPEGGEIEL